MRRLSLGLVLATSLAVSAFAQPFGIGVKGGVPLIDAFVTNSNPANPIQYVADTHRYTFGPYAELRLPGGFGLEVDALYRTFEYRQIVPSPIRNHNSHAWEFPVLAKWRFLPGPIKPYIEGGAAFSHLSINQVAELHDRNTWGLVVGGGVDFKLGFFHLTPEIRYTGWVSRHFDTPGTLLQSNRNQAAVLLGIGF
jgi:opacity protein-like surface antigen